MMLAPSDVNLSWQSAHAEQVLRDLRDTAAMTGREVRVTARATSHPPDARGVLTMKSVSYDFELVGPGGTELAGHVSFSVGRPPKGTVSDIVTQWSDFLIGRAPGG